jgi:hypothetical protein
MMSLTSRIALVPWIFLASGIPLLACPSLTQERPQCCHRKSPKCPITPAIDHCPLFLDDAKPEEPATPPLVAHLPVPPLTLDAAFAESPFFADHSDTPDQSDRYLLLRMLRN